MKRFRPARMRLIKSTFAETLSSGSVLDLGGTPGWWKDMDLPTALVTIVNLDDGHRDAVLKMGYQFIEADACSLPFDSGSFDLVVSNSVIEHVGGSEEQASFAREMLRCGRSVYMQTPNRKFLVEPHLMTVAIHWLPFSVQRRLVRRFSLWGLVARPTQQEIDACLLGLNLLDEKSVRRLFPGCSIQRERFLGLTKSFIAVRL